MTARELRFAFTVSDIDAALRLYRDVLGLQTLEEFGTEGARGVILAVPAATLELFDPAYTEVVDNIEVGRPMGETVRIAVKVDNLGEAGAAVSAAGAKALAPAVETPWGDRNRRFRSPGGVQLTLFQSP